MDTQDKRIVSDDNSFGKELWNSADESIATKSRCMEIDPGAKKLHELMRSCRAITSTVLSCKTFRRCLRHSDEEPMFDCKKSVESECTVPNEYLVALRDEHEVGKWLEAQITEYETAIRREELRATRREKYKNCMKEKELSVTEVEEMRKKRKREEKEEVQRLKGELFDETVRQAQERLLLHRIRISAASKYTTFPDSSDSIHEHAALQDPHETFLRREALRTRDDAVLKLLQASKKKGQLQSRLDQLSDECRIWQQCNQNLWSQLLAQRQQNQNPSILNHERQQVLANSKSHMDVTVHRLQVKNKLMKRALLDIISGCGVDWYADPCLRDAMMKLENS